MERFCDYGKRQYSIKENSVKDKILTVSIIGCGSRGAMTYGTVIDAQKERFRIVSICDISPERVERFSREWGVDEKNAFTDENKFFREKRSDILVIATQDRDHVRMCKRAFALGYIVLLEKPISPVKEELYELLAAQKQTDGRALVCHVLRYAPAFLKIKELLDAGAIGKLVSIDSTEQVGYWHYAHSFVRGNWNNDSQTSPMIMQKCCHDLDLLQYYIGAKCDSVYSTGGLTYFTAANKPDGAAVRCRDCKYLHTCPYSAERLYVEDWKANGSPADSWLYNVVCEDVPNTEEKLRKAYESGKYGRCVFACDNNVVDNQTVHMQFGNGVTATLHMVAFTEKMGRKMNFYGDGGEIKFDETEGLFKVCSFGKPAVSYRFDELLPERLKNSFGHGGGDYMLIESLYDMAANGSPAPTDLESSVESHLIALAAEESRKSKKVVWVHCI